MVLLVPMPPALLVQQRVAGQLQAVPLAAKLTRLPLGLALPVAKLAQGAHIGHQQ
jgi:hypothetical protein